MYAQSRIYVNEYLNIGVGARGLGLAGAQTASVNDAYAGYWNPAGLANIQNDLQVGLMHAEYFGGISKYDFASVVMPIQNKKRVLAFSFIRFATDNIPYTLDYVRPDGSFDESKLKGISAGDYAGIFSYAQAVNLFKKNPNIKTRIGASAKIIYRNIGSMANAWGLGVDAGMQMDYKKWKFGATFKDISTTYTSWTFNLTEAEKQIFGQTGNEIPVKSYEVMYPRFNLGAAYEITKPGSNIGVAAELGMDITTDGQRKTIISTKGFSIDPKLGIEANYKHMIYLRAGINNFYKVYDNSDTTHEKTYLMYQPAVGLGLKLNSFTIDYSFTSLQLQSSPLMSHIISLRLDINKAKSVKKPEGQEEENSPGENIPQ